MIELNDDASNSSARILPEVGFNCYSFAVEGVGELLWADARFEEGEGRPSGSGIPLLFPFPGRIAQGEFTWEGRKYKLPEGDGRGNAIHGFAYNRPWRVLEHTGPRVVGEFQPSRDAAEVAPLWPADYRLRCTYTLRGRTLRADVCFECLGPGPLPWGFGAHPYFRVPSQGETRVSLPVTEEWLLRELLPTGERRPVTDAETWVCPGLQFSTMQFDNVFTGLSGRDDMFLSSVRPAAGGGVELRWGAPFRELVVYTPGHREAVCVEPYTCVPGAIQLDLPDTGLQVLAPGKIQELWFELVALP